MKLSSFLIFLSSFVFLACSSKEYFEPTNTYSASAEIANSNKSIIDLSRYGATLSDGHYIGKAGISSVKLGDGYRFLNENNTYVLASNLEGKLKIIHKKNNSVKHLVDLKTPIVSVSIRGSIIAYILNNNTFGIYDMSKKKKIVENRSERIFAIDTRSASPLFVENLLVMPMLDGKIIIVSIKNPKNYKIVYISNDTAFNNVIHLSRVNNTMVIATATRIMTLGTGGQLEYDAPISEVVVGNNKIYLFSKEGSILALSHSLKLLHKSKFEFAHYAVATAFGNKVYALDQKGSLIVLNSNLSKSKIYDLGEITEPAFITGTTLYKDGKRVNLSALNYE
jgi:hypothetical protein